MHIFVSLELLQDIIHLVKGLLNNERNLFSRPSCNFLFAIQLLIKNTIQYFPLLFKLCFLFLILACCFGWYAFLNFGELILDSLLIIEKSKCGFICHRYCLLLELLLLLLPSAFHHSIGKIPHWLHGSGGQPVNPHKWLENPQHNYNINSKILASRSIVSWETKEIIYKLKVDSTLKYWDPAIFIYS